MAHVCVPLKFIELKRMSENRLKLNMDKMELLWARTRYDMSMLNDFGYVVCSIEILATWRQNAP